MAFLDIRHRTGYVFLAVVVGHVLLISAQINAKSGVPLLHVATFSVFSQAQRGMFALVDRGRTVWSDYIALWAVRAENDALRRQLGEAQVEVQQQRAVADRSREFARLLELRDRTSLSTTAAEVIASGATVDFRTITINKGLRLGMKADMAVIAPAGIVGRLVVASPLLSKVQLLIDRNAAAGALIERSRAQGVVVGAGDDRLRMDYVSEVSDVVVGDVVVTSGIDGIYPKGFAIGRVSAIEKGSGAYRRISVQPSVNFSSLEEVLVVLTPTAASDASESPR